MTRTLLAPGGGGRRKGVKRGQRRKGGDDRQRTPQGGQREGVGGLLSNRRPPKLLQVRLTALSAERTLLSPAIHLAIHVGNSHRSKVPRRRNKQKASDSKQSSPIIKDSAQTTCSKWPSTASTKTRAEENSQQERMEIQISRKFCIIE